MKFSHNLFIITNNMKIFTDKGITHLDLHGQKHINVTEIVIDFVYRYQDFIPLIIICGNSNKMQSLVTNSLKKEDIIYSIKRYGIVRVEGFNG